RRDAPMSVGADGAVGPARRRDGTIAPVGSDEQRRERERADEAEHGSAEHGPRLARFGARGNATPSADRRGRVRLGGAASAPGPEERRNSGAISSSEDRT